MTNDYMSWAAGSDIGAHLPYIHERAKTAQVAVELGVRNGCSTAALLAGLDDSDGWLWSVDVDWPAPPANGWITHHGYDESGRHWGKAASFGSEWGKPESPRWSFLQGDDLDAEVVAQQPDVIDLLFIDTSHRYQHTLDELTTYGPRVQVGGVILLHDTELEVAPLSVQDEDKNYPVRRAIEDYCRSRFLTPEWREGCYGLGVIEVT